MLTDDLISYWKLDESSGDAADAHGSNTLTNTNTVPYGTGKINNGAQFASSSTKYLSITDEEQTGLDITGNLSVSFWVNWSTVPTSNETLTRLFTKSSHLGDQRQYYGDIYRTGGVTYLRLILGNGVDTSASQVTWSPSTSTWYHISMTYEASTKYVKFYVNGSQEGTTQTNGYSSIYNGSSPFYLCSYLGNTNIGDGTIDEFGIWSRVLSTDEITQLYNGGPGLEYPFTSTSNFLLFF